MSVYSFSSASFGNWGALQTSLASDLPASFIYDLNTSSRSTASTSFTDLHTYSFACSADEAVLFLGSANLSSNTQYTECALRLRITSTNYMVGVAREAQGVSDGYGNRITLFHIAENLSGTIDFKLQFCDNGTGPAGTVYCNTSTICLIKFKKR